MKLNRTQRRLFNNHSEDGRKINALPFNHPKRVEARAMNMERGKAQHEAFTMEIQERITERLSPREAELTSILKGQGLKKKEIDAYLEVWVNCNFWPKPDNHIALKKQLKSLNKKYNIYG